MKTIRFITNRPLRPLLILPLLFCVYTAQALPTLTLTATNGTCVSDCKITATVLGAQGDKITYSLINYPIQGQNSTPQTSNIFADLLPGTYTVGVYDETTAGIPVTQTITVTTTYQPIAASEPIASNTTTEYCNPNGTLSITFTGGKAPFRVKISNQSAPYNTQETIVTSTASPRSCSFSALPPGQYAFEIQDACDQWQQNIPNKFVTVNANTRLLEDVTFNSLDAARSSVNTYAYARSYSSTTGKCTNLTFYYYYTDLRLSTSAGTLSLSTYTQLKFRINYPAGSENFTSWLPGYSQPAFSIDNYDRSQINGDKYIVQVQHPCTEAILSSPVYTFPIEPVFRASVSTTTTTADDYCSTTTTTPTGITVALPNSTSYRGEIQLYNCYAPYTVTLKQGTNTVATQTIAATGYTTTFSGSIIQPSTTYTIDIAGGNGFYQNLSVTTQAATTSAVPSLNNKTTYRLHTYSSTSASYVVGYNYSNNCDYATTGIYAYFTAISGKSVTYSIAATGTTSPITRNPITLSSSGRLWTDLPWGTYNVTADYGCGSYPSPVTLTQTVSGFSANELTYTDYATVCGRYSLSGEAYFLNMTGARLNDGAYAYRYYMLIVDGPEKVGTRISTYSSTSNKATITDLPGGTYKVVFYPYLAPVSTQTINGKSVAYYPVNHNCLIEKTINIPEYIRPVIDIPYSGGISCTDGLTNMTITVGWGNKPDFSYRYKVKNAADNTYDPANFQPSNVFSDVSPGDYTVQIKDQCGSITTQNVHVFDGTEQFVGIIGEVQPGVICEGRDVTLSVLSIGPVQWYEWYYSATGEDGTWTTLPSTNPTYVINSATQSDKGYYKVKINNGLCDLESEVHIVDVIAPAATPSITGEVHDICAGQSTTLTAHTSITSPSYRWYKDGVAITGAYSDTYQVVATGSYTVDVTPPLACSSDQSLPYVVTALQLAQPIISPTSASICIGDKITLTATTSDTGVSYTWYKNNVQVHYSSTSNTYDASESGTYTVKTTHIQLGCISPLSVGVVVTVNPIPSVAISAAPGFEVCESNVTEITFTATPTNGGVNPTYAWKVNGAPAGTEATLTLNNLKQYRPKSTVSCTMTSDNVACSTTTATDEKNIRISSCVVPVNPSIRGRISN